MASLVFAACSADGSQALPAPESEAVTEVAEGPEVEPVEVEPTEVVELVPPPGEQMTTEAVLASTSWFKALGYAAGDGLDGLLLDVSNDGAVWLVGGGEEGATFVLAPEPGEIGRLADVSASAKLSGNGEYVLYSASQECATSEPACGPENDERYLLRLSNGEVQALGAIRGPVVINATADQVVGLVAHAGGQSVEEGVEWADGSTTKVRLLFSELGELPPTWLIPPRLHGVDGAGEVVLYSPWAGEGFSQEALYSALTPQGNVDLAGEEMLGARFLQDADISEAGDYFVFSTTYGLTAVGIPDGAKQNYLLEKPDRFVHAFAAAGGSLLAVTVPVGGEGGAVEIIRFERDAGPFEQVPELLVRIPDATSAQTPGEGGLKLHVSADGTAMGVSVLVDDPDHPAGVSWLNILVDLRNRPDGAYIEVTAEGTVEEASSQRTPVANDPESAASLAGYLADLYDVGGDLVAHQAVLNSVGAGPVGLSELWSEASDRIESLDPPDEAVELHERWQALATGFIGAFGELLTALESTDQGEAQRGISDFLVVVGDLGAEAVAMDRLQVGLTINAFETRDDPIARYIAEAVRLQSDAGPIAERMFSALGVVATDPPGALEIILGAVNDMQQVSVDWEQLQPPSDVRELHERRLGLLRDMVNVFGDLNDAIESATEPEPRLVRQLEDLAEDSQQLNAAWSRFLASALRETN